eukprot:25337-Pyramimonas_sp.AAC.1
MPARCDRCMCVLVPCHGIRPESRPDSRSPAGPAPHAHTHTRDDTFRGRLGSGQIPEHARRTVAERVGASTGRSV